MEIPTSWNDRGLLRHEPFLSAFDGLVAKKGGKGLEAGILADIVKGLKDKIAIDRIVQAWIQHAFIRLPEDEPQASPPTLEDPRTMHLFVDFYFLLARESEGAALFRLNRGRRHCGFLPVKKDAAAHLDQGLIFAPELTRPVTRSTIKKRNKEETLCLSSQHIHRENGLSSSAESSNQEVPCRTKASPNMEDPQSPVTVRTKRKGAPDETDSRLRKKPSDSARGQQRRVQSSDATHGHTQTVAIHRPKNGEIVRRLSRNTELSLSSVQLGLGSQIQKGSRSPEFNTADDEHNSRAKQEGPRIPSKWPASPDISRGRKRRSIDNTNVQNNLQIISSEPENGLSGRTSRSSPPIAPPSTNWDQRSDVTPLPSPGACSVFLGIATTVQQSGCGASSGCKSLSCLTCGSDSKPGKEVAYELENNPEYTLQVSLSREIIPRQKEPSQTVDMNAQCVQENSSNLPELDRDLPSQAHSNAVASMQGPSIFNDGYISESLSQGRQDADMSQIEILDEAGIDTKIECVQDLIPLVTEGISLWTVIPEQDSQLSASVDIKAKLASTLPPLQLPLDPLPQIMNKVPLPEFPPIWAQSRQEVCESFDWFRSYQGGVYHVNEMARGYLLSGFPSSRDRFEHGGKLIISHGGGRAESLHTTKGQSASHPASDQLAQDKSIRALLNNYKNKRPLALLIDDKYILFPYDLGAKDITYAVLGFYTVEHVWAEYQRANNESGHVVRYKFAFRWCEDQGDPWWSTPLPPETLTQSLTASINPSGVNQDKETARDISQSSLTSTGTNAVSAIQTCETCYNASPRVFHHHWTCLVPECPMFWKQTEGPCIGQFIVGDLNYHPQFLQLPPCKPMPFGYQDVVKSLTKRSHVVPGTLRNYHFTRGFHCSKCGRLSSRSQWEKWQCAHCYNILQIAMPPHLAKDIWNQTLPMPFRDYLLNPLSDIVPTPSATFSHESGRGIIRSFILPESRGKIHHIQPGNPNGRQEADRIFLEYQEQAASGKLPFRRWPLRAHKCRGPLLTNYFSHNAGEPYKYVGGDANTVPFSLAPAPVCNARHLIEKRVKQALDIPVTFNEVLSAAYMERQKMAFHSDNEVGLGPVVAGLSLGSPALMHFRLHSRLDPEREKKGILLSIVLRHGDVLVMDGAGVQECYEHTVIPNNFRIAATARQIGATHS